MSKGEEKRRKIRDARINEEGMDVVWERWRSYNF